jgi:hypothetical protein
MADKMMDMKKLVARFEPNAFGKLTKQDQVDLEEDTEQALAYEAVSSRIFMRC